MPCVERQDDVARAVREIDGEQLVVLVEIDRVEPVAAHVGELVELGLLDDAALRHHDEVLLALEVVDREDRRHLFARRQREQVDERRAARLARRIGNLVAAQPIDAPLVREEQHVVVRLGHEEVAHDVFALEVRDAGDAAAAAVLRAERIDRDALDVAADGVGHDDVDVRR